VTDDFDQLDEYELLGITPGVTPAELKRAYHTQIGRYHPDRFGTADADSQGYAARRTIRINAAYRLLRTDPDAVRLRRSSDSPIAAAAPTTQAASSVPPTTYSDQQAGLYDRAMNAADSGDFAAAVDLLQELIALNPFYRDAVSRLEEFELRRNPPTAPAVPLFRRLTVPGGLLLVVVLLAVATLINRNTDPTPIPLPTPTADGGQSAATAAVTETAAPTGAATTESTLTTLGPPDAADDALVENGAFLTPAGFDPAEWPTMRGSGWQSGPENAAFIITTTTAAGPIFSYRSLSGSTDAQIGVSLQLTQGQAGLLLRYDPETRSYLAFVVDPAAAQWRLELHRSTTTETLVSGDYTVEPSVRLVARLTDSRIELRIDGRRVALLRVTNPEPTRLYGMIAAAGGTAEVSAVFTELEVRSTDG
jgi:hypothetical protein